MTTNLEAALACAERGWYVLPGHPVEKRPGIANWQNEASKDPAQIRAWWQQNPQFLVGINVGMSGLLVVDIDVHNEEDNGYESIGRLCEALGQPHDWLDHCSLVSRSGGGGQHHLFKAPDGMDFSKRKIGWMSGVDVLVGSSYTVLPPSRSLDPRHTMPYEWLRGPDEYELEPLPAKLLQHLAVKFSGDVSSDTAGAQMADVLASGSGDGRRNEDLIRLIGWMRRTVGDDDDARAEIRRRLEGWRDRCRPPYRGNREDEEFERTWQSGMQLDHTDRHPNWPLQDQAEGEDPLRLMSPLGLSEWLEPRVGARLRYRDETSEMLVWEGARWMPNDKNDEPLWPLLRQWGVVSEFERTVRAMMATVDDSKVERELKKWMTTAMDRRYFAEACLTLATEGRRVVYRDDLDSHLHLLHCKNGVVDLRTGELLPHDPALLNTALVPFDFNPFAESPKMADQLAMMFPGDREMPAYLQRAVGVSCFGDNRGKALFVLRGPANTGKSTLLQALLPVLGAGTATGYADVGDKKLFVAPKNDQHPAGLADALQHRLVLMSEEYGERDRLNMPLLKAITGNDRLTARFMRQDFWSGTARCTPWLATNHDLRVAEFDESVRTRLRVIDVPGVIPKDKRRPGVIQELLDEAEGLLAWVVAGAVQFHEGGLREPASVMEAVDRMLEDQDRVRAFLKDRLAPWLDGWEPVQLAEHGLPQQDIYQLYEGWCMEQGSSPLYQSEFAKRLRDLLQVGKLEPVREHGRLVTRYPVSIAV